MQETRDEINVLHTTTACLLGRRKLGVRRGICAVFTSNVVAVACRHVENNVMPFEQVRLLGLCLLGQDELSCACNAKRVNLFIKDDLRQTFVSCQRARVVKGHWVQ